MWKRYCWIIFTVVFCTKGFMELELAQKQLAEEMVDQSSVTKAKELIDRMKQGIGGTTVAVHSPNGREFIFHNKWMMQCNGEISRANGHCNGDPLESVTAFRAEKPLDYCYLKNYHTINDTLCLSGHMVEVAYKNNTVVCEGNMHLFPAYAVTIDDYLANCERISQNVTYLYYANENDPDHVTIPNDNLHVKCDNFNDETFFEKSKFEAVFFNRSGICVFTENDKTILKLLQYLKL